MNKRNTKWSVYTRLAKRKIFSALGNVNQFFSGKQQFNIRKGYHHSKTVLHFDDTVNKDEWQKEVYQLGVDLAKQMNNPAVLDVGCGSGYKLVHMFSNYKTTGIEVNPTYTWLTQKYPDKQWLLFNTAQPKAIKADIIICSDVIEHVKNPDELLAFVAEIPFEYFIVSTPEREALFGKNDFGPPANPCHFREWNAEEFKNYVGRWFHIESQHIFKTDNTVTQALVCKK